MKERRHRKLKLPFFMILLFLATATLPAANRGMYDGIAFGSDGLYLVAFDGTWNTPGGNSGDTIPN